MKYKTVVCGGTFDGLHKGHEALLAKAFAIAENVTIGLTTDFYVTMHKQVQKELPKDESVVKFQTYIQRKEALEQWLKRHGWLRWTEILPLDDTYGNTVPPAGLHYDAIVVSSQTRPVATTINKLRKSAGWPILDIIEIPMVLAEDGKPIASKRLRNKEIDRTGHIIMPDALRPVLRMPLGHLMLRDADIDRYIKGHKDRIIITVGDMASKRFLDMGLVPSLAIIDLHVRRRRFQPFDAYNFPSEVAIQRVKSGPGYISAEAIKAIDKWAKSGRQASVILVDGEEDLLILPVSVRAPLGSIVYYGQPGAGMVAVEITKAKRQEVKQLLDHFIREQ